MSNGEYALVPHIDFEPKGPIGKKAQLEIDKIKMSREQKLEQEFLEDVAKKQKEDRVKAKAKKDFEKKKIEHGVADWNQKEQEKQIVFKDGEAFKMKELESKHGLPEIALYNFEEEEQRDVQAVKLFMKKYNRLWKFLYNKYANCLF